MALTNPAAVQFARESASQPVADALADDGAPTELAALPAERQERVLVLSGQIDPLRSETIIAFGVDAQRALTEVSEQILSGVRNKDTGSAGEALGEMTLKVRELGVDGLRNGKSPNWFERVILGKIGPLALFLQRYETVSGQVERVQAKLEGHRLQLVEDVTRLDALYEMTLDYFHRLQDYILAAGERVRRLDQEEIPALEAAAGKGDDMLAAQRLADLRSARDDLERKAHDLKLTRQATMQSLPSIRMNQELDKSLVTKIQSVLLNTLPIWKTQLAQAVTLFRTRAAADTLHDVNRLTNQLLEANASNLRAANRDVRGAVEASVFSIDSLEKANQLLIDAIADSLQITEQARQQRRAAEQRLVGCETALKQALRQTAA